jgi:hypothetical protein
MPPATVAGDPHCSFLLDDPPDPAEWPPAIPPFNPPCRRPCSFYASGEREVIPTEAVSSLLMVEPRKFAMRQGNLASARKTLRRFALTRKIFAAFCCPRLETASARFSAGKEVISMRSYHVRVFVPQDIEIRAEDDGQALVKVGQLYQEYYAKVLRGWIEPLEEPQDLE